MPANGQTSSPAPRLTWVDARGADDGRGFSERPFANPDAAPLGGSIRARGTRALGRPASDDAAVLVEHVRPPESTGSSEEGRRRAEGIGTSALKTVAGAVLDGLTGGGLPEPFSEDVYPLCDVEA